MTPDYITDLVRSCSHRVICADFHKHITISPEHIISVVDQFIADYKPANNLSTVRRNRVIGELVYQLLATILYKKTPSTSGLPMNTVCVPEDVTNKLLAKYNIEFRRWRKH